MKNRVIANPSKILLYSFLLVIVLGTLLLMLPISHNEGVDLIDCLFTSVSATCVTGLMTITPFEDLTIFGQIVLIIIVQIGGLGLISFIALFLRFRKEKLTYDEKNLLKNSFNKYDDRDVSGYLVSIFKYTFITELIGFIILSIELSDGSVYSLFQCLFLSISSFCNAGMDIFGNSSLLIFQSNVLVNIVVSLLIILGGIGFIVWFDFFDNIKEWHKRRYSYKVFFRKLKLHTKIVVSMTLILLITGMIVVLLFENNNVLLNHSFKDKILISFFSSVSLRTAGFYTTNFANLRDVTKLIMCIYMLVGASPGGTAGGFKTTTFFLMFLGLRSMLKGRSDMIYKKRKITSENYAKASMIIFIYFFALIGGMIILTLTENLNTLDLLFEASSALGTVGLTANVTTNLSIYGKFVIMLLMFVGRVGPTTLLLSLTVKGKNVDNLIKYPAQEIIVG